MAKIVVFSHVAALDLGHPNQVHPLAVAQACLSALGSPDQLGAVHRWIDRLGTLFPTDQQVLVVQVELGLLVHWAVG